MATAVQRRVRGQPHAAAAGAGASRQPLDQATGVAVGVGAWRGVGASRGGLRGARSGRGAATGAQLRRPEAAGAGRRRPPPYEATPQGPTIRAREAPQGPQEGREESQEEVNLSHGSDMPSPKNESVHMNFYYLFSVVRNNAYNILRYASFNMTEIRNICTFKLYVFRDHVFPIYFEYFTLHVNCLLCFSTMFIFLWQLFMATIRMKYNIYKMLT